MDLKRQNSIRQLRTQFFTTPPGGRPDRKLKRSFTENIRRESIDSGLSSPTNYSLHSRTESDIQNGIKPHGLTRHLSLDNNSSHQPDNERVHVLHEDAESTLKLVDELVSTKTMRRRRTESASLSISERKRYATESVSSYTPVAPSASEWGQKFDEMIAKLKGIENCAAAADEAHICDSNTCASGCILSDSVIDSNSEANNVSSVFDIESNKGSSDSIDSIPQEEITPHKKVARLFRSNTDSNTRTKSVSFDMKTLMRSLSFQNPDVATYNRPLPLLRRTDSGNDVWIERPMPELNQPLNKPDAKTHKQHQQKGSTLKRSATWTKISKIFVSSKTKA